MRKVGLIALGALFLVLGGWISLLVFLPDAPRPTTLAGEAATREPKAGSAPTVIGGAPLAMPPLAMPPLATPVLAMPVLGVRREVLRDSWGDPRDNGLRAHHGTDIMAPQNTPVVAAAAGTIEKLWTSAAGGTTLYVRSPGRDWTYYYAHLSGYAPGVHEGQVVSAGDPLGYVGDTGNAGAGNYHLHFGLTHTTPEQHWYQGQDVDPYPYLAGHSLAGKPAYR